MHAEKKRGEEERKNTRSRQYPYVSHGFKIGSSSPLVKVSEERLEFELRHAGEVDRIRVGGALGWHAVRMCREREREHGAEDQRVLGQEVPVDTEKTALDLLTRPIERGTVSDGWNLAASIIVMATDLEHCHLVCKVKFFMSARGLC